MASLVMCQSVTLIPEEKGSVLTQSCRLKFHLMSRLGYKHNQI